MLVRIAEALLEHEVLDAPQLTLLIEGRPLPAPKPPEAPAPQPAAARETKAEEAGRAGGILPPPMAAPRPTS